MTDSHIPQPIPQGAEGAKEERKAHPKSVWIVVQDDPRAVTLDIDGVPRILGHGHHNLTWLLHPPYQALPPAPAASGEVPPRIFAVPLDESVDVHGIYFASLNAWNTAWRKPKPKEYLSLQEHAALLSSARAEAEKYRALYDTLRKPGERLKAEARSEGRAEAYRKAAERMIMKRDICLEAGLNGEAMAYANAVDMFDSLAALAKSAPLPETEVK